MNDYKGQVIKGYQLDQLIGSGGFGAVYRAHQAVIDREVAIKVILPDHANDPHFIRNFESEAHLIARLEHPFIVPLYDFWRDHEGAFLVMRYYPTGNLSQLIHHRGAMDLELAAKMIEQIASALDAAHANQIIHRDIKPANILIDSNGNAYLSDFGLAEDIASAEDSGDMVGSPAYLPPEVIQSQSPSPQSDLYSLGFVLYEMLTGKYAFAEITPDSSIMSILDFHLNETIPDNLDLSDAVNFVIQRATAKDPEDRYPTAMAMATAFREAVFGDTTETVTSTIPSEFIVNPYKGLRAFDEADEMTFFGRDKLVKRLLQQLASEQDNHNFIALVGPSGSGKSSVVHAGLVPALRRGEIEGSEDWFILDMVPGSNPFSGLVAALRSISLDSLAGAERDLKRSSDALLKLMPQVVPTSQDNVVLVIDQFEELFTQTEDVTIRRQFLDLLYTTLQSKHFYLVMMLRADFYDRPMMHEGFGQLIQARTQVVLPLTSTELTNVITKPAEVAGLKMQQELTTAIIADVQSEAVALPLLQYALTEVFERRDENQLTLEGYQAIGGIAGALAYRADEIYNQLSAEQQEIARQLFLRFVTLGEGTEDTRRRAKRSELLSVVGDNARLQSVLDAFGNARLLTFDNDEETREPTVEVAHEALIREWNRLRDWLDVSRDDVRQQRVLNANVRQWLDAGRDESYLLRGVQLSQIEAWQEQSSVELTDEEAQFVAESHEVRDAQARFEAARKEREEELERSSRQRLQLLMVVFAIAAVIAGGLSVFGFTQANNARNAEMTAEANEQIAEANAQTALDNQATAEASQREAIANADIAAQSQLDAENNANVALSIALASNALREHSRGRTDTALALALDAVNFDAEILDAVGDIPYNALLEISRDPGLIFEESVVEFPIEHIAIAPDGSHAVFGASFNASRYWDLPSPARQELNNAPQGQQQTTGQQAPPNGQGGQPPNAPPNGQGGQPPNAPPQGRPNAQQGQPPPRGGQQNAGAQGQQTQNERPLLPSNLFAYDLETLELWETDITFEGQLTDLLFFAEAGAYGTTYLLVMTDSGNLTLWDYDETEILNEWQISAGYGQLTLADDQRTLFVSMSGMDDVEGAFVVLDVLDDELLAEYPAPDNLTLARMTGDGAYFVGLLENGNVIIWDVATGEETGSTKIDITNVRASALDIVINPDSESFLVNSGTEDLPNFALPDGNRLGAVRPLASGTHRATFNADGTLLFMVSRDGEMTMWNFEQQFLVQEFSTVNVMPSTVTYDTFRDVLMVTSNEGTILAYSVLGDPVDFIGSLGSSDARGVVWLNNNEIILAYRRGDAKVAHYNIETEVETIIADVILPDFTLHLSGDGRYLLAIEDGIDANGHRMMLFDLETLSEIPCDICADLPHIPDDKPNVVFRHNTEHQLIIARGGSVRLYDVATQSALWYASPMLPVTSIASSHDGTLIAVGVMNGRVHILDAETGETIADYEVEDDEVAIRLLTFTPDDEALLLTEEGSEEVKIYSVSDGEELLELEGHNSEVTSIQVIPERNQVLTASDDMRILLWDLETGEVVTEYDKDVQPLELAVSPDGTRFISTGEIILPQLWSLDQLTLSQVIEWTYDNRVIAQLTEADCQFYGLSRLCDDLEEDEDEHEDDDDD